MCIYCNWREKKHFENAVKEYKFVINQKKNVNICENEISIQKNDKQLSIYWKEISFTWKYKILLFHLNQFRIDNDFYI